jgi:hypothetical protein
MVTALEVTTAGTNVHLYDNLSELDGEAKREKGKVMDDMRSQLDDIGRQITDRFINQATMGAHTNTSQPQFKLQLELRPPFLSTDATITRGHTWI